MTRPDGPTTIGWPERRGVGSPNRATGQLLPSVTISGLSKRSG
jgi:hypothetical protein